MDIAFVYSALLKSCYKILFKTKKRDVFRTQSRH
jgi:hypothetical protein